jgi:hypothetical protein
MYFWNLLGRPKNLLGISWEDQKISWEPPGNLLGTSWEPPGNLLGISWEPPGNLLGTSWESPGKTKKSPGNLLGRPKNLLGISWETILCVKDRCKI